LFIREPFPRFDLIQYGRHAFSYVFVQVTVNAPLVRVKLLRAVNRNPDSYSYSYSCLCERSLRLGSLSGHHSPDVATKLSTISLLMNLTESVGKEDPATQPPPPQAARGERWDARWRHVPKAQGLKCHGRGLRPCNRQGDRGG